MTDQDRELKNAVFAAKEASERARNVSREEMIQKELGIEVPFSSVPLPSKGLIYPEGHPLYLAGSVDIKTMTTQQEDILMSEAYIKKGTVVSELIKSCLCDPRIDTNTLLLGDRNALMVSIRIAGYGSDYPASVNCAKCDLKQEVHINLEDLNLKFLELTPSKSNENEFQFILPVTKKEITFRFLTEADEKEITQAAATKKKKGMQLENSITTTLLHAIVAIGSERDRNKVAQFVQYMPARDSAALRKHINENEPGVDLKIPFECMDTKCGYADTIMMPWDLRFFWNS